MFSFALLSILKGAGKSIENLGQNGVELSVAGALTVEIILTFIFVLVVMTVTSAKKGNASLAGIVIGLTLTMIHLVGIPLTGTSVNPARSIAPAVLRVVQRYLSCDFYRCAINWWIISRSCSKIRLRYGRIDIEEESLITSVNCCQRFFLLLGEPEGAFLTKDENIIKIRHNRKVSNKIRRRKEVSLCEENFSS